jgi:hypothetical protein
MVKNWLNSETVILPDFSNIQQKNPSKVSRPRKKFEECGRRAQQKKTQNLISAVSTNELSFATQMSLRKCENRDAAKIVQNVTAYGSPTRQAYIFSPIRAKKYKLALQSVEGAKRDMSAVEAFSLIINTKSSKSTCLSYREASKQCEANIYPSWHDILFAKKMLILVLKFYSQKIIQKCIKMYQIYQNNQNFTYQNKSILFIKIAKILFIKIKYL